MPPPSRKRSLKPRLGEVPGVVRAGHAVDPTSAAGHRSLAGRGPSARTSSAALGSLLIGRRSGQLLTVLLGKVLVMSARQKPTIKASPDLTPAGVNGVAGLVRPDGPGMYLFWEGRRSYRTSMPAPRVLEPVPELSYGEDSDNLIIEGDNLQAMVSLRSQYRSTVNVAYIGSTV
jgi:hypothetical protein